MKIIEATEHELYELWLEEFEDIMDFRTYLNSMRDLGVVIKE